MILGIDAGARGNLAKQRKLYEELVRLYPDDERSQVLLGKHYFDQQAYGRAVGYFDRAIQLNPEHPPAYNLSGYAMRFLERHAEAEQAFKKYVELIPSQPQPHEAYAEFRALRAKARKADETADSLALAGTLIKYSERGEDYIATIRGHITANRLQQFDEAALAD